MSSSKPTNSFKALQEVEEVQYQQPTEDIKETLDSNFGFIKMFGQIMELYLPKVFEMIVHLTGGTPEETSIEQQSSSFYDTDDATPGSAKTDLPQNDQLLSGD
ncbi:MAG: hypothetical protein AB8G15_03880 [Saprospiraceae bacterium]